MDIDPERIAKSPFVVGLLGGIVALRGVPGITWKERVFNVFCASLIAGFLTPGVAEYFGIVAPTTVSTLAFLLGLFGLNAAATAMELLRGVTLSDVMPWRRK